MASETSIVNQALGLIGQQPISSLSENSPAAQAASTIFKDIRDAVLRDHFWNFASKRVSLAKLSEKPSYGYENYFQLPSDFVRVIELEPKQTKYEIEGTKLLTDENSLSLKYVYKAENTELYDPIFVQALAHLLASQLAYTLTGSSSLGDKHYNLYTNWISKARGVDATEGKRNRISKKRWVEVR